ncbi:Tat pathway signal sequence domain protein [Ostertagia ostertagi]
MIQAACACGSTHEVTAFKAGRLSRRSLLAGAGGALFSGLVASQTALTAGSSAAARPGIIDVHHHVSPPSFIREIVAQGAGERPVVGWTLEKSLEDMDRAGVATSITSITTPDFIPVSLGAVFDAGFAVGPSVPASVKNMTDFFNWCKANPGAANFGSPATASTLHFVGSMAARAAGVELTHVPFRGTTPAILDMIGGQIAAVVAPVGDFMPFLDGGKCRILATTGAKRNRFVANVPTFVEQGYKDIVINDWFAFFVPAKTPQAHVQRLNAAIKRAMETPAVVKALEDRGLEPRWSTSADLAARLKADMQKWQPIARSFNFTVES